MELAVVNNNGKNTGRKVILDETIFGINPNDHAIYLIVKQNLANRRQGTHKTKERSDIIGSTRKIKKQKGTGTARAGSIKNPIFRGGGRIFGPIPRKYKMKINRKVNLLARKSALSIKAREKSIIVIEDFKFDIPNTSNYVKIIKALGISDKKSLMIFGEQNNNVYLSSRNLDYSSTVIASELSTYKILNASVLIFFESSISGLESFLKKY